jgi:hypothetical protein
MNEYRESTAWPLYPEILVHMSKMLPETSLGEQSLLKVMDMGLGSGRLRNVVMCRVCITLHTDVCDGLALSIVAVSQPWQTVIDCKGRIGT